MMNPSSNPGINQFSRCSIGNICSAMGRGSVTTSCLSENRGVVTITGSECGNGIVEEGEDCDCGDDEACAGNTCCDAKTCKYAKGAVCDDSNEDCCRDCQYASSNTVCRPSTGECDPEEKCTGDKSMCPSDVQAPDGDKCGDDGQGLACASGECTSRDMQCKSLVGTGSESTTSSCKEESCTLSCQSAAFEDATACYWLPQNFLDGTPCRAGGKCNSVSVYPSRYAQDDSITNPSSLFREAVKARRLETRSLSGCPITLSLSLVSLWVLDLSSSSCLRAAYSDAVADLKIIAKPLPLEDMAGEAARLLMFLPPSDRMHGLSRGHILLAIGKPRKIRDITMPANQLFHLLHTVTRCPLRDTCPRCVTPSLFSLLMLSILTFKVLYYDVGYISHVINTRRFQRTPFLLLFLFQRANAIPCHKPLLFIIILSFSLGRKYLSLAQEKPRETVTELKRSHTLTHSHGILFVSLCFLS